MQDKQSKIAHALKHIADALAIISSELEVTSNTTEGEGAQAGAQATAQPCPPFCEAQPEQETFVAPAVQYDNNPASPTYNPAPPFRIDPVPPRSTAPTDVPIITKGEVFVCRTCLKNIMQANRDIDGSGDKGKGLSRDAFTFLIPDLKWPEKLMLYNEPTGKAFDCPRCCAVKSLWIIGGPDKSLV